MNIRSYAIITERIVALLEQGTVPWHRPWTVATGLPRNFVTGKPYRGINVFLLLAMSYESPHWLTLRQANRLSASVRKGEKACPVVFWKRPEIEEEADEPKKPPVLRLYHVFNAAQCQGLKGTPATDNGSFAGTKPAEIVSRMPEPPAVKHGMTKPFYSPPEDTVGMPERDRFDSEADYYAALFHELVHSTGHERRLKRPGITERNGFGSDPYSKEELVAELGSAYLCAEADLVDRTIDNSAAYLEGWLAKLKHDRTLIVSAAAQAQKAADFILNVKYEYVESGERRPAEPSADALHEDSVPQPTQLSDYPRQATRNRMSTRTLKIEEDGDPWAGKITPKIRLKGRWLEQSGFTPGSRVRVETVAHGVLELRSQDSAPLPAA